MLPPMLPLLRVLPMLPPVLLRTGGRQSRAGPAGRVGQAGCCACRGPRFDSPKAVSSKRPERDSAGPDHREDEDDGGK